MTVFVYVRPYTRRKPKEAPLARSTLVSPGFVDPTSDYVRYGKRTLSAMAPSGKKFKVIATVLGGGSSPAKVAEGAELDISTSAWNEAVADTMDDLFGFDIVPPTYLHLTGETARGKPVVASAQVMKSGTVSLYKVEEDERRAATGHSDIDLTEPNKKDLMKIVLFDLIVGHADRHSGNIIVDRRAGRAGRAYAIDNENAFTSPYRTASLRGVVANHSALGYVTGMPIPADIRQKIADVTEGDFRAAMAGFPKDTIDKAWLRKKYVESLTVMPTRDAIERYSWANDL